MSIRRALILTNLVVFGIILVAVAVIVYHRTRETEIARIDSRLDTYAASLVTEYEDHWENNEFPDHRETETLAALTLADVRVRLLDSTGRVLFGRGGLLPTPHDAVAAAFRGHMLHRTIVIGDEPFRLALRPVATDDTIRFTLALATPAEEVEDRLANLLVLLSVSMLGALLLSGLAVYYFTGRAFRPVTDMVDASERISAATLDQRLAVPAARNEVSRLAEALNAMMSRIEAAFRSQRQFVSDASHELRTPLTVVYGELDFLRRQLTDSRLEEGVDTVIGEIDRLARLVDQLLVLARLDASSTLIDAQPVRLDEVAAEAVRLLGGIAREHNVEVNLQVEDVVEITGDPDHLKRALLNVLDNAVKYSPRESLIDVVIRRDRADAVICVCDHGPGIAPDEIERVFRRFYRSPRARQAHDGSGLGLAIARELIGAHGGSIRIAASDRSGTTVEIRLPVAGTGASSDRAS